MNCNAGRLFNVPLIRPAAGHLLPIREKAVAHKFGGSRELKCEGRARQFLVTRIEA